VGGPLEFGFDFSGTLRGEILAEASQAISGWERELAPGSAERMPEKVEAAKRLLTQLGTAIAELGAYPDILPVEKKHFSEYGLSVPTRFEDLNANYRFYWLRVPVTLMPGENMPFVKLECAIEFNPDEVAEQNRPRALSIFPDKKFQTLLATGTSLEFGLREKLDLDVTSKLPKVEAGVGSISIEGGAAGKLQTKLNVKVGPFEHVWKKALIDHSTPGTEKVFWRIEDTEFFTGDPASFVVVLQIPHSTKELNIAAVLQAYPKFSLATADLGDFLVVLTKKAVQFFRGGAPVRDTRLWHLSASL
jgi:hypothetical protein